MATQQKSVVEINVNFWHACDFALRDFRSQHRVSKYSSKPTRQTIRMAAGIEARIPKLCEWESENFCFCRLIDTDILLVKLVHTSKIDSLDRMCVESHSYDRHGTLLGAAAARRRIFKMFRCSEWDKQRQITKWSSGRKKKTDNRTEPLFAFACLPIRYRRIHGCNDE